MTKIMLVEDDKSLREIYSIRLVAEGYNIVSADDGEEALAMAVQEKPDLIIADVMMPKISGFDMLDILRSTPETQNVKIVMMTALSGEDQRQRGESLGADRYLVKSQVGIEDVVATVHEVLGDAANTSAQTYINAIASGAGNGVDYVETVANGVQNSAGAAPQAVGRMMTAPPATTGAATVSETATVLPAGDSGFENGQSIGGERVIQPINDPRMDQARADMQRKMDEALNGGNVMGMVDISELSGFAETNNASSLTSAVSGQNELGQVQMASAAVATAQANAVQSEAIQANVAQSNSQAIAGQAPAMPVVTEPAVAQAPAAQVAPVAPVVVQSAPVAATQGAVATQTQATQTPVIQAAAPTVTQAAPQAPVSQAAPAASAPQAPVAQVAAQAPAAQVATQAPVAQSAVQAAAQPVASVQQVAAAPTVASVAPVASAAPVAPVAPAAQNPAPAAQ